ncbi:beta-L-arabinofuranosidase domain-containing protein [Mucilaginibacter antarcticus]
MLSRVGTAHGVNLAQGIKEPLIYYQQHPEEKYIAAMKKGFADLTKYNGMAHGLYGADESMHGNNPTQGSELCTAVEMMFSLESSLAITGDVDYADRLEKIAFNALPAQASEDYMTRQYFQQANQVSLTRATHNFNVNHAGTDVVYGLLSGYPCCTSNMHQGWPKFTQNLWYATPDKGVAALIYSASEVNIKVANNIPVTFKEETNYPFNENIKFTLSTDKKIKSVSFPFHLRVPAWCRNAVIKVNGRQLQEAKGNQVVKISREWKSGDVLELQLPMHVYKNTWYENSISVERGPLVYGLKIGEETKLVKNDRDPIAYGAEYLEVRPTTPWNYALIDARRAEFEKAFTVQTKAGLKAYPWTADNAPLQLTVKARKLPNWKMYNDMAGPLPFSVTYNEGTGKQPDEDIVLLPYGCTRLRISQFPVIAK